MKIRLVVDGHSLSATLDQTPVARDFASLLPLELMLEDYASAEKIADLPRRLSVAGAPDGTDAAAGDICYYAPWGNLAIFYRGTRYAPGLVRLGRIDGDVATLRAPRRLAATIERVEA